MKGIKIKVAKAHEDQLQNLDISKELKSVQEYFDNTEMQIVPDTVGLMCLRGYYDNFTKRMNTVFVFINNMGKDINEIHGVIRITTPIKGAQVAKSTIDFDKGFLGELENGTGCLIHLDIPTRGIEEDRTFTTKELEVEFTEVRVTYVEKQDEKIN